MADGALRSTAPAKDVTWTGDCRLRILLIRITVVLGVCITAELSHAESVDDRADDLFTIEQAYPTIGVCGLDCGLCPRYYTKGTLRCPGCAGPDFFNKHPSCSFITCCVKNKNLEDCAECTEFPCPKFRSDEEYKLVKESSSYPSYKKVMSNLNFIKQHGIEKFVEQQKKRIKLLERMIADFDDGKSRSFFCKATALMDIAHLEETLDETIKKIKTDKIKPNDMKRKAKILKETLNEVGFKQV